MCKYDNDFFFPDPVTSLYVDSPHYVVSVKRFRGKVPERTKYDNWESAVQYANTVSDTSYVVLIVDDNGDVLKKYINYLHQ